MFISELFFKYIYLVQFLLIHFLYYYVVIFFVLFKSLVYTFSCTRPKEALGRCSRKGHLDFFEITLWPWIDVLPTTINFLNIFHLWKFWIKLQPDIYFFKLFAKFTMPYTRNRNQMSLFFFALWKVKIPQTDLFPQNPQAFP